MRLRFYRPVAADGGPVFQSNDPLHNACTALLDRHRHPRPPESRLWLAVLVQAIFDAWFSVGTGRGLTAEREQARAWFGSHDFQTVCERAGLDPDFVMRVVSLLRPLATHRRELHRLMEMKRQASLKRTIECRSI